MPSRSVLLKQLLQDRHWQTYRTFCREYNKAARIVDNELVGSEPSRAQLHRWLTGDLRGIPYSHHCRVLEAMFPGIRAAQMFKPVSDVSFHGGRADDERAKTEEQESTSGSRNREFDGRIIFVTLDCAIDIDAVGSSEIVYRYELLNRTDRPIRRIIREQWFETTDGRLRIEPLGDLDDRQVKIQRIHDTPNMSKFACVFSPSVEPGDSATVGYVVRGGIFVHDHYWRQSVPGYTQKLTLTLRHRSASMLVNCFAIVDRNDGSQESAIDDIDCLHVDGDAIIAVTREDLELGEAVTVRWEVSR
jgi:hypothetical protein